MSAVEVGLESEGAAGGAPPRHIDPVTALLDMQARAYIDAQQFRLSLSQRDLDDTFTDAALKLEKALGRKLERTLRSHALWPWLSELRGLRGPHVALLIGRIGDPRRYPGQRCSEGHYLPPLFAVGATCPVAGEAAEIDETAGGGASTTGAADVAVEIDPQAGCPGVMLPPRTTTGVRSIWHWAGLHAVDGKSPRKRKGVKCDWEPRVRASLLMDNGIADQIVRHRTPRYREVYDATKERLLAERGLRPIQAEGIARKVAVKAFVGDLLTEWKGLV